LNSSFPSVQFPAYVSIETGPAGGIGIERKSKCDLSVEGAEGSGVTTFMLGWRLFSAMRFVDDANPVKTGSARSATAMTNVAARMYEREPG
jgi:hypothetical protein